jgi:catechol 2,3-dioxygenase-like lactoylglutathione lyase family enzyme
MGVTRLIRVSITVADLAGIAAFYRDALGLDVGPEQALGDPAWNALLGLDEGTTARAVDVTVGEKMLKLVAFGPPRAAYPAERDSNDQWFEHVALVTGDITAVWERLEQNSPGVITKGAPVLLPPNTGRVTAFKFRDPEGHPLELISFPKGVGDPQWQQGAAGIRGYDHTAISVMDVNRSTAFYTKLLGFHVGGRSLNIGPEQDRLDGLKGCEVDVVALQPAAAPTPHVELLHYRTPPGRTLSADVKANDVASARQVHKIDDLDRLVGRLEAAGVTFVSPGIVTLGNGGKAATIRDPDGHMIVLMA